MTRDRYTPAWAGWPRVLLRVGIGFAAAAALAWSAAVALLIGSTLTTGCFFTCERPNPLLGIPVLVLSSALFTLALAVAWWGLIDRFWAVANRVLFFIGAATAIAVTIQTVRAIP